MIPPVLQAWRGLQASLPRVTLPIGPGGSPLDFSLVLGTAAVLGCFNVIVSAILTGVVGFPKNGEKVTTETTAALVAIFHSTNLLVALGYLFATQTYQPSAKFSQAPEWWQEACHAVLQFCTGYMVYDALVILVHGADESDLMFVAHHLITILYMTSTRVVGAGHFSAMIAMFLGEFTNPFHNGYYIARNALSLDICSAADRCLWMRQYDYVNTFCFALTYCILRTIVCPAIALQILYDTLRNGRKHIPLTLIIGWNLLIWTILYGSVPWVVDCWNMLQDYLPNQFVAGAPDL